MKLVVPRGEIDLTLKKDLVRSIKRGHAWCYSDSVDLPRAKSGSVARLWDRRRSRVIALGIYDAEHPIPLRVCTTDPNQLLDDAWADSRLARAVSLRRKIFDANTTGVRLVAGEGDQLPGVIVDRYDRVAVLKLDGGAPQAFYSAPGIAQWLVRNAGVDVVVQRFRERGRAGEVIAGSLDSPQVHFMENGLLFSADVIQGQKTGFFLDQRDNREVVRRLASGSSVLNLFSFNGGFSIAAGVGGAAQVTSVDIAAAAVEGAHEHWLANGLDGGLHRSVAMDCFEFLEQAIAAGDKWDVVICDPPSFAPNHRAREKALAAYRKLAELSARCVNTDGLLALASCSSHIGASEFDATNRDGIGRARRCPALLSTCSLPADHPTPAEMPELRYLKFQLYRID